MDVEERNAIYSPDMFAGSRPGSNSYNSHHDSSSFDAPRLELMQRAQRAEAEELERRRSMRWSVLQNKHQMIKSTSPASGTSTSASASSTGMAPRKQRSTSPRPSISIRKKVMMRSPNALSIRKKVMVRSPYTGADENKGSYLQEINKKMKGDASEAPSEVSSLASSKPKEEVVVEDEICSSATALGSLSFLTSWYTGTDTTTAAASTGTAASVPTNAAEAEPSASPPVKDPYDSKKSSLHAFPSSPYWDNKTKTSSTTIVVEKKIMPPKPTPPGVAKTIKNIKKKIHTIPPSPNASPPQVVMTATPSSTIGTGGGTFDSDDMDDYSLSSESLTLLQLGHHLEGGSRNSADKYGAPPTRMDKKKSSVVLYPVQQWTGCQLVMMAVGAVLTVAFLMATGSLFWTLTTRYYEYSHASTGPVLTATVYETPDISTTPFSLQNNLDPVDEEKMTVSAVLHIDYATEELNTFLPDLDPSIEIDLQMVSDLVDEVNMAVSAVLHNDYNTEDLSTFLQDLDPSDEIDLQMVSDPVDEEKIAVFAALHHDTEELSTSLQNQDPSDEIDLQMVSDPVDEEEVAVPAALHNDYDTEDLSTFLQNQDPSDEIDLQIMVSDPVDVEEGTVSHVLHNDYDTEDLSNLLQDLDLSDETDLQIMVSEGQNMDAMGEETPVMAVSLPKCFAYDRWNQTMLSDEASQEFVLWAHFSFWRSPFASPWSTPPLSPLKDEWRDFSANVEMLRFLTIMDPEFSIIPGKSCRSWDSLVDLAPSIKRIETLQDAVSGGGDDDGIFLHVPLVDVVSDFLHQKGHQMQNACNFDVVSDFVRQKRQQIMQKASTFDAVGDFLRQKRQQMQEASNYQYLEEAQPRVYY